LRRIANLTELIIGARAKSKPRSWLLCASLWLAGGVMVYDFVTQSRLPLSKWPVDVSPPALARCLVIAAAAYLLVRAIRPTQFSEDGHMLFDGFGQLRFASALTTAFIATTAALLLIDPALLSRLRREDEIIENLSAIFLLAATVVTWLAIRNARGHFDLLGISLPAWSPLLGLGALFLLISLEEISWGQRIFGFVTPEILSGNTHGQTNLHNFATHTSEHFYYGTAFCAFVLLPYAAAKARFEWPRAIAFLTPAPEFALVAAPAAFIQSEMWNNVPVQIAAWGAAFILADFALRARGAARYWAVLVLSVCVAGQAVFLGAADDLIRIHDLTEYKETLIAFLCFTWAIAVCPASLKRVHVD
jgi:hypothetical protein